MAGRRPKRKEGGQGGGSMREAWSSSTPGFDRGVFSRGEGEQPREKKNCLHASDRILS